MGLPVGPTGPIVGGLVVYGVGAGAVGAIVGPPVGCADGGMVGNVLGLLVGLGDGPASEREKGEQKMRAT